jgi:FkbM family methyltransferase
MEYEPVQPFFLIALAEEAAAKTFIDVGSNIGAYALFATLTPSVTRVVAFEANPDAARELRANIALNELTNRIEVDPRAVSDAPGSLAFGIVSKFSGANSVVDTSIHDRSSFHEQLRIEAVTIDQLFEGSVEPFCIKIDVEGHEAQVLEGARRLLSNHAAIIQIEAYCGAENGSAKILRQLGFFCLTAIGPDRYYSNMERFRDPASVVQVYEDATARLIAYNHRNKAVLLKRGDFALQFTGKSATVARELAKRIVGKRL